MSIYEKNLKSLMIAAQGGDERAYEQLLESLYSFLEKYLVKRIFNKTEIEEVSQEILIALHKAKHTYDSEKVFMSWFMAITEYKIIDFIRSKKNEHKSVELDAIAESLKYAFKIDSTYDLERAFKKLNDKEQKVLQLLRIEGHDISEVAEKLSMSAGNVKVVAHRAYRTIQEYLEVKIDE